MSDAAMQKLKEGLRQFNIDLGRVTIEGYRDLNGWIWPDQATVDDLLRKAVEQAEWEAAPAREAAKIIEQAITSARGVRAKPYILNELATVRRHAIMEADDCIYGRKIVIFPVEGRDTINSFEGWTFYLEWVNAKTS